MARDKGSDEAGKPLGLRLSNRTIVEFKQEAARLGISGSALFMKLWAARDQGSQS